MYDYRKEFFMAMSVDIAGRKYNRLTADHPTHERSANGRSRIIWHCQCDCGNEQTATADQLRSGAIKSCGCLQRERAAETKYVHGGKGTRLYNIWKGMNQRCTNPGSTEYRRYGARGITVCDRWRHSFAAFREDMGEPPSEVHTLDRIKNHLGYEPGNCRWATSLQQENNKRNNHRITFDGETLTISEWSRRLGICPRLIWARISRLGWTEEEALTIPTDHENSGWDTRRLRK
jgi:hypothetical protein